jgi:hypothetical protein
MVRMAEDEQKVTSIPSKKDTKPTRSKSKSKSNRYIPFADATAIGRKLSDDEAKNFVGLLGSHGLNVERFCRKLVEACRSPSTIEKVDTAKRQIQYVLSKERNWNAPLAAECAKTLNITIKEFDEKLRSHAPASAEVSPQPPTHSTIDKRLLSHPLVGAAFSDRGSIAEWNFGFESAQQRLNKNPEDTFLRAILVWSTLLKGNPDQIIEVVQDAAMWLQTDAPLDSGNSNKLRARRKELWLTTIAAIRDDSIEDAPFVRRVLEDTLVREALLRWLKSTGKHSPLAERIRTIKTPGIPHTANKILRRQQNDVDWVAGAIKDTNTWISAEHHRGLAKLFLIWLTGRDPGRNEIASVIKKSFDWLDHHPGINDTLVRWGAIWLAGMSEDEQFTNPIIDRTSRWLQSPASKGDRLVRTALLWFVGEQGNAQQVNSVIAQNSKWLDDPSNRKDNCIRIALLFCIRRAIERGEIKMKQLQTAIGKFPPQIRKDQLIELAVTLAERPLAITHSPIARPTDSRLKRDL